MTYKLHASAINIDTIMRGKSVFVDKKKKTSRVSFDVGVH